MKLVVTGALGHIGSRLIRELPRRFSGAEIVLVDDLSTQRYCSLFGLPRDGRYRFVEADVLRGDIASVVAGATAVVHLAAMTDATSSFQMRERVEEVNVAGTERVAHACLETGSPMVFASTTSVYGTQAQLVDEDCPVDWLKPQSPYAESKLESERCLRRLGASEGLRFVTCRFGTIFGVSDGMRFHTAVNKFCWQASNGQAVTVWRTARHQLRPYLDVTDAVAAIGFIVEKALYDGTVYNVVTTNASVNDILEIIASRVSDLEIQYVDSAIMNQLSYEVSSERLKRAGFQFAGDLRRGICETLDRLANLRGRATAGGERA